MNRPEVRQPDELRPVPPDFIRTPIAAVSVGIVQGRILLDLCYEEDSQAEVDLNVVMTGVEVQGTAEKQPFSPDMLIRMLDLAPKGIADLIAAQEEALR